MCESMRFRHGPNINYYPSYSEYSVLDPKAPEGLLATDVMGWGNEDARGGLSAKVWRSTKGLMLSLGGSWPELVPALTDQLHHLEAERAGSLPRIGAPSSRR